MNFYIAEPVTRLPLFNFLVRYIFTEVLLEYIMRELARWYDIEVFFVDSDKQNEYYSFEIERSSSLKQVMNILEKTRTLDIELKGRTVIIR